MPSTRPWTDPNEGTSRYVPTQTALSRHPFPTSPQLDGSSQRRAEVAFDAPDQLPAARHLRQGPLHPLGVSLPREVKVTNPTRSGAVRRVGPPPQCVCADRLDRHPPPRPRHIPIRATTRAVNNLTRDALLPPGDLAAAVGEFRLHGEVPAKLRLRLDRPLPPHTVLLPHLPHPRDQLREARLQPPDPRLHLQDGTLEATALGAALPTLLEACTCVVEFCPGGGECAFDRRPPLPKAVERVGRVGWPVADRGGEGVAFAAHLIIPSLT